MNAVEQREGNGDMFFGTVEVEQEVCGKAKLLRFDQSKTEDENELTEDLIINSHNVTLDLSRNCEIVQQVTCVCTKGQKTQDRD